MTRRASRRERLIDHVMADRVLHCELHKTELLCLAAEAQRKAKSYRGANYGCAALGLMPDGTLRSFWGANSKKAEGPRQHGDLCGEMRVIDEMRAAGCIAVVAMVIYGPAESDDATGANFGPKPSCTHCRTRFRVELRDPTSPLKRNTHLVFVSLEKPDRFLPFDLDVMLMKLDGYILTPPLRDAKALA